VVVDFGVDHAFGQVPNKLQEHYGIDLPSSTIRRVTEWHAAMSFAQKQHASYPDTPGCEYIVAEMDGSMIPIVETRCSSFFRLTSLKPDKSTDLRSTIKSYMSAAICHNP